MQKNSLIALAGELLAAAHKSATGRSTHTLYGGHRKALRQNLIALTAGTALPDQDSRGETILQVLQGHVRLTGNSRCDCTIGDHLVVPRTPQCLEAIDDSVVLVTVAKQSSNA
ncbi:LuxR family transcriptional regulator [Mycobacterium asiaticum]|uniref:LuxR family transcriptional regulator n=1 Tax=Mycobacterium asiaticum TaxID=1790 RepID=A0A1A3NG03_MYCAS|nr:LuxR family transcriptional regulator [Mycobacterium asiaticum]OBK20716.1 LuxR family transcriptional regulator [Mycobacterium asiaticum]